MNAEFRIFTRTIGETFKGIKRARWMNVVIVTTMAAILTIFACFFRSSLYIAHFVSEVGNSLEVSIYLKPNAKVAKVKEDLLKYNNIKTIKVITKEEAWKNLKEQMDLPEINNPLPDTIRIQLRDKTHMDKFINSVKQMEAVEGVQYAKELADQISRAGYYTNIAALIVIILLGGLTLFIINNTIHLVIESRKQEIDIMKMMGVSNWYIKAPYIYQGAFYGFWGALISIIPLFILNFYLQKLSAYFYIQYHFYSTNVVIAVVLATGIIVGALGSMISVKKYLKV